MKTGSAVLLLILFHFSSLMTSQNKSREMVVQEGDTTFVLKQYFLCIYKKGSQGSQDSTEASRLQSAHLQFINENAEKGLIVIAGPFGDDGEKRGILILDVETLEAAIALVKKDPMVIAGRLDFEINPWWGPKGSSLK